MRFIRENRDQFEVSRMCSAMGVSQSGYFAWLKRKPSDRTVDEYRLKAEIEEIYHTSNRRYGSPKIRQVLIQKDRICGHNRVARIMREVGIRSIVVKKKRPVSSSVNPKDASKNLLKRRFQVRKPNRVWVTDITYVRSALGWLYLCVFMDLYSRKIVGWAVSQKPNTALVLEAFRMACKRNGYGKKMMIHSDQGTQFGSNDFRKALKRRGLRQSMSRRGDCWDNACMESFFRLIKVEEPGLNKVDSLEHLKKLVFRYIEFFYNPVRLHSANGYRSPIQYEQDKCA